MAYWVYIDRAGEWRWRLVTDNHRTIADSGEAYTRERDAERAIATVQSASVRARAEAAVHETR